MNHPLALLSLFRHFGTQRFTEVCHRINRHIREGRRGGHKSFEPSAGLEKRNHITTLWTVFCKYYMSLRTSSLSCDIPVQDGAQTLFARAKGYESNVTGVQVDAILRKPMLERGTPGHITGHY